jgi:hypothetical protein
MHRRNGGLATAAIAVVVVGLVFGATHLNHPSTATTSRSATVATGAVTTALATAGLVTGTSSAPTINTPAVRALIAKIPATSKTSLPTYVRTAFGPAWADTDRNGCDQRNDVLSRDMTSIVYKAGTHNCVVLSGTLADDYTGKTIAFTRGQNTSEAVQIDHLVPLGWAWQHGASSWTENAREKLATDLNNLQAVDGPTNGSKSDQGPATWLPPETNYDCLYVTRFAFVVSSYHLTLDAADRGAIDQVLGTCHPATASN